MARPQKGLAFLLSFYCNEEEKVMGEAIKIRKRTYWTTETFKERMKEINPNVEVLGEYINSSTKIKCKCLVCNYDDWYPVPSNLLSGSKCPKCSNKNKSIKSRKTNDEFLKLYNEKIHNDNIEFLENYISNHTDILVRCKIDGYEWPTTPHELLTGHGCPVCDGKTVIKGINDIATIRPDLVKYFNNIEDAYSFTIKSTKKCKLHCINCGYPKSMKIQDFTSKGFPCPICGDGVSYPNKFSRAFLSQLPIQKFIPEYSPKWANGRRYDNYFEYNGKSYILEMDGGFHYQDKKFQSAEETQIIDEQKNLMAYENNIELIRIECKKSEKDYIKNNILKSKLNSIFDLSYIDWDKCNESACNSLVKEVCNSYNNIIKNQDELAFMYHISSQTIRKYLKIGYDLGWCQYKPKSNIHINVYIQDCLIHSFSSIRECEKNMKLIYPNIFLSRNKISDCCNGKISQYKGFQFKFA